MDTILTSLASAGGLIWGVGVGIVRSAGGYAKGIIDAVCFLLISL